MINNQKKLIIYITIKFKFMKLNMNTFKVLENLEQSVLDKDSFGIVKSMVREWEEFEENEAIKHTKNKMMTVFDQMKGFHNSMWWITEANFVDGIPDNEKCVHHGEIILLFISQDNAERDLDYGF